jgi:hypothetical protein
MKPCGLQFFSRCRLCRRLAGRDGVAEILFMARAPD